MITGLVKRFRIVILKVLSDEESISEVNQYVTDEQQHGHDSI